MDPNETLRLMIAAAQTVVLALEMDEQPPAHVVQQLAEAALNLDDWLARGGFAPDAWGTGRQDQL